jgi:hypothetical protein
MPTIINPRKAFLTQSGENLNGAARNSLNNLADQLRLPSSGARYTNALPKGNGEGDQNTTVAQDGTVTLTTYDRMGNPMSVNVAADSSTNLAFKTGTADPVLADYPNDGDNGWFYNTTASQLWYVRNYQGTLVYINFVSVSGTISALQHGDLSGAGGTMHNLNQLNGELTDTQHGDRGRITGGNPMHTSATTTEAGFMSASDKTKVDNAVSTATASRLVIRDASAGAAFGGTLTAAAIDASGNVNTDNHYSVDGTQVVGNRNTGWTTQSASSSKADLGASPTVGALASWARAIQDMLATHGLLNQT